MDDKKYVSKEELSIGLITGALVALFIGGLLWFNWPGHGTKTETTASSQAANQQLAESPTPTPTPIPNDRDETGCFTAETAKKHYGENDCVVFTVAYTYKTSAGTKFLDEKVDYNNGFVVYIPSGSNFSTVDIDSIKGKKIKATGLITEYSGHPQIEATEYSQVKIY